MVVAGQRRDVKKVSGMSLVERWAHVESFNPGSHVQVKDYLKFKGYPIPKERVTKKETSNEEALDRLIRKFPGDEVLPRILEARHLKKAEGYLGGTALGMDGRFHPFYTFKPETGRLSSVRPNMQNIPNMGVNKEVATKIRSCIIPSSPSKVLVEVDWKAMEAVLTGFFADDPDFIRVSKLDSHSLFLSNILHKKGIIPEKAEITWSNERLAPFLADLKKRFPGERFQAKTANLATSYGMQWKHLSEELKCSAEDAKLFLVLKEEMAPKVAQWKKTTILQAHNEGFLETPFGYKCYFWEVLRQSKTKKKPNGDPVWVPGKEANSALAFRPQSSGSSMLREVMLSLALYDGGVFNILVPIHDALLVECEEKDIQQTIHVIKKEMERNWEELGGMSLEVDVKIGANWAEMEVED